MDTGYNSNKKYFQSLTAGSDYYNPRNTGTLRHMVRLFDINYFKNYYLIVWAFFRVNKGLKQIKVNKEGKT